MPPSAITAPGLGSRPGSWEAVQVALKVKVGQVAEAARAPDYRQSSEAQLMVIGQQGPKQMAVGRGRLKISDRLRPGLIKWLIRWLSSIKATSG